MKCASVKYKIQMIPLRKSAFGESAFSIRAAHETLYKFTSGPVTNMDYKLSNTDENF